MLCMDSTMDELPHDGERLIFDTMELEPGDIEDGEEEEEDVSIESSDEENEVEGVVGVEGMDGMEGGDKQGTELYDLQYHAFEQYQNLENGNTQNEGHLQNENSSYRNDERRGKDCGSNDCNSDIHDEGLPLNGSVGLSIEDQNMNQNKKATQYALYNLGEFHTFQESTPNQANDCLSDQHCIAKGRNRFRQNVTPEEVRGDEQEIAPHEMLENSTRQGDIPVNFCDNLEKNERDREGDGGGFTLNSKTQVFPHLNRILQSVDINSHQIAGTSGIQLEHIEPAPQNWDPRRPALDPFWAEDLDLIRHSRKWYAFTPATHKLMVDSILEGIFPEESIIFAADPGFRQSRKAKASMRVFGAGKWRSYQEKLDARVAEDGETELFFKDKPDKLVPHLGLWKDIVDKCHVPSTGVHYALRGCQTAMGKFWVSDPSRHGIPGAYIDIRRTKCSFCALGHVSETGNEAVSMVLQRGLPLKTNNKRKREGGWKGEQWREGKREGLREGVRERVGEGEMENRKDRGAIAVQNINCSSHSGRLGLWEDSTGQIGEIKESVDSGEQGDRMYEGEMNLDVVCDQEGCENVGEQNRRSSEGEILEEPSSSTQGTTFSVGNHGRQIKRAQRTSLVWTNAVSLPIGKVVPFILNFLVEHKAFLRLENRYPVRKDGKIMAWATTYVCHRGRKDLRQHRKYNTSRCVNCQFRVQMVIPCTKESETEDPLALVKTHPIHEGHDPSSPEDYRYLPCHPSASLAAEIELSSGSLSSGEVLVASLKIEPTLKAAASEAERSMYRFCCTKNEITKLVALRSENLEVLKVRILELETLIESVKNLMRRMRPSAMQNLSRMLSSAGKTLQEGLLEQGHLMIGTELTSNSQELTLTEMLESHVRGSVENKWRRGQTASTNSVSRP